MIVLLIFVALAFDFMNGFHDAANSIATVVSTRVLTPRAAVAWGALFNFLAALRVRGAGATPVGEGNVPPPGVAPPVLFPGGGAPLRLDRRTRRSGPPPR